MNTHLEIQCWEKTLVSVCWESQQLQCCGQGERKKWGPVPTADALGVGWHYTCPHREWSRLLSLSPFLPARLLSLESWMDMGRENSKFIPFSHTHQIWEEAKPSAPKPSTWSCWD